MMQRIETSLIRIWCNHDTIYIKDDNDEIKRDGESKISKDLEAKREEKEEE